MNQLNKEENIRDSLGRFVKGKQCNEKHPLWKGADVGYGSLHSWIRRKLGSPKKCSSCGSESSKKYEWANISKKYKRDLSDWKRLCILCHHKFDNVYSKMMRTRKIKGLRFAKGNRISYKCKIDGEISYGNPTSGLCQKHYLKEYYQNNKWRYQ